MSKFQGNPNQVSKLYQTVIDDVINNIREAFLEDGVDEQVLHELKHTWKTKVEQSKAVDHPTDQHRNVQTVNMPMFVSGQLYTALPRTIGAKTMSMTSGAQQASLALPSSVAYQQKLPNAATAQQQVYNAYQPAHQISQHLTQPVVVTTSQGQEQVGSSGSQQQPSVIIQVDGASDQERGPCCSKDVKDNAVCKEPKLPTSHSTSAEQHTEHSRSVCSYKRKKKITFTISQVDGASSSEEDDESDDDDDDDEDEDGEEKESPPPDDFEPLCTDDDDDDEDPVELFDTDNVVVCQYDKIHRTKQRWKFNLKVGIMNLNGKDYVFQRATGEADW